MSSEVEIWRSVNSFPGTRRFYQVSSYGRVRTISANDSDDVRILKGSIDHKGYHIINIRTAGRLIVRAKAHRWVADAFVPRVSGCDVVNHIDGNKLNNRPSNLEWTTLAGNLKHSYEAGLRRCAYLSDIEVLEAAKLISAGVKLSKIAKKYGCCYGTVYNIAKRNNNRFKKLLAA